MPIFILSLNFEIETEGDALSMEDLTGSLLWRLMHRTGNLNDELGPSDRLQSYWMTICQKQIPED